MENTDLKFYESYELSECNIIKNTNCGLAVLSRYPINCIVKELFPNPKLSKTTSSGKTYYTYDKGYMVIEMQNANIGKINLLTHHGFPYRRFNSTPEDNRKIFDFFDNVIEKYNLDIITGDFNAENFIILMDKTSQNYRRTINDITTVDGKKFDDILVVKNMNCKSKIIKLLSDHFMIVTEIDYKNR